MEGDEKDKGDKKDKDKRDGTTIKTDDKKDDVKEEPSDTFSGWSSGGGAWWKN